MVAPTLLAALTAYSAVVAAAPAPSKVQGFSVNQVSVPKTVYRHPAAELARAYKKFHVPVPSKVAAVAAASASATTTPTSGDEEYITQVTVGSDTLGLDIDTGSADL